MKFWNVVRTVTRDCCLASDWGTRSDEYLPTGIDQRGYSSVKDQASGHVVVLRLVMAMAGDDKMSYPVHLTKAQDEKRRSSPFDDDSANVLVVVTRYHSANHRVDGTEAR